jgi:peptidoglycan/LPS O-acetylase OafA/YrhL
MNRSTSLYLDIVRPLAAMIVLLSHVSYDNLSGGQLSMLSSSGIQAVDIFFVLSGFVIAHVCATRENDAKSYFVSRATRIYSVAIPAIVITVLLDFFGHLESPATYDGPYQAFTPGVVLRSVFFLGEQWNTHRFPGSDGPYWSLGFEVWYYVAFGLVVFLPRRWRWVATAAVLAFIGPKVALMFPSWLLGVAAYHFCVSRSLTPAVGWLLLIAPIVAFAGYEMAPHSSVPQFMALELNPHRIWGTGQDYLISLLFALHLVGYYTVSRTFDWLQRYARGIRWIAGATFTIYLMHLPIMHFISASSPWPKSSPWTVGLLLILTPMACFALAEASERRKEFWRVVMMRALGLISNQRTRQEVAAPTT